MQPDYSSGASSWLTLLIPLILIGAPLLAMIPGFLAKNKGYSFAAFYVPAIFVWLPMLIAAIAIRKKPGYVRPAARATVNASILRPPAVWKYTERPISGEERLRRLTILTEQGMITAEEYEAEKRKTGTEQSAKSH